MSKEKYSLAETSSRAGHGHGVTADAWVTVHLRADADEAGDVDALDQLAARAAELLGVHGVECREPSLLALDLEFEPIATPELVAHCVPDRAPEVARFLLHEAAQLGLRCRHEVIEHRLADEDWRDAWKRFHEPFVIGSRLLVRPSWRERGPHDPPLELVLDPGRAFGTGLHASTRLCLDHLLALAEAQTPIRTVLDLGCGSGILGLAAQRFFAPIERLVLADFDGEAIEVAQENADRNAIPAELLCRTAADCEGRFDLVLANLRADVLVADAVPIRRLVGDGGRLVLSGILDEELTTVMRAHEAIELRTEAILSRDGWASPRLRGSK